MAKPKPYGGRWSDSQSLTEGGQSRLFLVRDLTGEYQEQCVLKRVLNPKRNARFEDEVKAVRTLQHENIVRLLDASALEAAPEEDDRQYLVMPFAAGGDLARNVARFKGRLDEVIAVARQIASALKAAHAAKIIHRDVKPENILFSGEGDHIWLADFGICLIEGREPRSTEVGEVVGPVMFMAPELEDGSQLDVTSDVDIYSLGKVIYYMISGGVRLPRERLYEPQYSEVLSSDPRLLKLKVLLSQMICEKKHRISVIDEVIARLDEITSSSEQNLNGLRASDADDLKRAALDERVDAQRKKDEEARRISQFDDVRQDVLNTIMFELENSAQKLSEAGLTESKVTHYGAGGDKLRGRAFVLQAIDGAEITYNKLSGDARITAFQFVLNRKAVVTLGKASSGEKIVIYPVLQIRESDNKLVKGCSAHVARRPQGRGKFAYSLSQEPVFFEIDVESWPADADALRSFVNDCAAAFPEFIKGEAQQFIAFQMQSRRR